MLLCVAPSVGVHWYALQQHNEGDNGKSDGEGEGDGDGEGEGEGDGEGEVW